MNTANKSLLNQDSSPLHNQKAMEIYPYQDMVGWLYKHRTSATKSLPA